MQAPVSPVSAVEKPASFAAHSFAARTARIDPNSSDVSVGLIKRGMFSDEFDGPPQAIIDRYAWRPGDDVPGAAIVGDKLHDLAQRRPQPLVILDDGPVQFHEPKNSLGEPAD